MNVAFTIVARNYLSFALTLAESYRKFDSETGFIIFIVDSLGGVPDDILARCDIRIVDKRIVPALKEMAFKYSVTEYCTAVKPFVFHSLFEAGRYERAVYLDPDICLYSAPEQIYNLLDKHFCILTPHLILPEISFTGNVSDTEFLFAGIYNLGFIALKNTKESNTLLQWWMNRLENLCYGERSESLHVDQKWIDFVPSFFDEGVLCCRHPGLNIAYWNIHERILERKDAAVGVMLKDEYTQQLPVVFIHYSGINPVNIYFNKQCKHLDIKKYPVWEDLTVEYANAVNRNAYGVLIKLNYGYACFDNGDGILPLHRRILRRLMELDNAAKFENLFGTGKDTFYELLKKNRLLAAKGTAAYSSGIASDNNVRKLKVILWLLRRVKYFLGIKKYLIFIRVLQKVLKNENQIFHLEKYSDDFIEYYKKTYF
jgi:hypothetical protein